ncbi:MAG: protoporphyrinogen oxidase [Gemmatimonadales bacterium]
MIAVVGGGITGLALGWELASLGEDLVVLEATGRVGGVIRSAEVEGRVLDFGPQRLRLTRGVAEMVGALGLDRELLTAPSDLPLYVFARDRLRRVPRSIGAFATTDALSTGAKLRALLEPLTGGARPTESVAEYFTRKLGRELYQSLAGPLYGGLYASDPADMEVGLSLAHTLREMGVGRSLVLRLLRAGGRLRGPAAVSFARGLDALPMALQRSLGAKVVVDSPVRSLTRRGAGWRVESDRGVFDATAVVLTTPAEVTAALLSRAAPSTAAALAQLRYNPLAVVHVAAEAPVRAMGFQVALSERARVLRGVTFNECLFGRRDLCTAYLGGSTHPEVERMRDDELGAAAVRELHACTVRDARVLSVGRARMPAWDRSWRALERVELPEGVHLAANWWSRPGVVGRLAEAKRLARALHDGRAA